MKSSHPASQQGQISASSTIPTACREGREQQIRDPPEEEISGEKSRGDYPVRQERDPPLPGPAAFNKDPETTAVYRPVERA